MIQRPVALSDKAFGICAICKKPFTESPYWIQMTPVKGPPKYPVNLFTTPGDLPICSAECSARYLVEKPEVGT